MTIRSKLAVSISLLVAVTIGLFSFGVLMVRRTYVHRDAVERTSSLEALVAKAAQDALLQKDDLLLVSSIKFMKLQRPSLAYAIVNWEIPGRVRRLTVGESKAGSRIQERLVRAADPVDLNRRVTVQLGIDQDLLFEAVESQWHRLIRIMAAVSVVTILLGVGFSYWFAHTLTSPLGSLSRLANEIGAGKLGGRLEWSSEDEIGDLVKVFNKMSQRLEDLDETKKNFVSSVTHELRSPLGAIESFLHLIQGKLKNAGNGDAAQCQEYLGRIQVNVHRLSGFINDLLDVAKIEKGKMECVLMPMRLHEVASDVCQFFEAKARQHEVRLSQNLDGLPLVLGDPGRLRQVIVNLVSNSLKFTPGGGRITITGEQFREGDGRWVEVTVSDTGRGMDQKDLDRLFIAFSQGRNVGEGVAGSKGTGLGLFITKSIVDQHGGKINVKSAPGKGTKISFTVKAAG